MTEVPTPEGGLRFPVLERLEVEGYDLFPGGGAEQGGLDAHLHPGLTLILGANGLGKTTLVWMLYRLLTGPYDIPALSTEDALGGKQLTPKPLRGRRRRLFGERVVDDAANAEARLSFRLGTQTIRVMRSLADLTLVGFSINDVQQSLDEADFQSTIANLAGVWAFGDWILLLRYLVFYFEDRRALVWDSSAQRQILRLLFLPRNVAREWTQLEREVLQLDSRVRNLSASLGREEKALAKQERLSEEKTDIQAQLQGFLDLQEIDEQRQEEIGHALLDLDSDRRAARLEALQTELRREEALRALEHAKLVALQERFPTASETAKYILAQLMSEHECLVCGAEVPDVAEELQQRINDSECVVCGSVVGEAETGEQPAIALSDERLEKARKRFESTADALATTRLELNRSEAEFREAQKELLQLEQSIADRRDKIDNLLSRLPKEEAAIHQQRDELAVLRGRVAALKEQLSLARGQFVDFIDRARGTLVEQAPDIKSGFEDFAREFLIEECELSWSPRKARVGQTGVPIEFPSFDLNMASASFESPVLRSGPEQVSESQREFIDLAFRMALMGVADPEGGGTLVIDAPESSLDAVFVTRAAQVLGRFASSERGNRLIVTSNLTDGRLIPSLLAQFRDDNFEDRIIDLFEIAEPTAAVRSHSDEYASVKDRLLVARGRETGNA